MTKKNDTKLQILEAGLRLSSQVGLSSISIGELAKAIPMSKSGLFAHFKSKENLQLSILQYASDSFTDLVLKPALTEKMAVARILKAVKLWNEWSEKFSKGNCIFVASTIDFRNRPGRVQDILILQQKKWIQVLAQFGKSAIKSKEFASDTNCEHFAFDLNALLLGYHYHRKALRHKDTKRFQDQSLMTLINNYK